MPDEANDFDAILSQPVTMEASPEPALEPVDEQPNEEEIPVEPDVAEEPVEEPAPQEGAAPDPDPKPKHQVDKELQSFQISDAQFRKLLKAARVDGDQEAAAQVPQAAKSLVEKLSELTGEDSFLDPEKATEAVAKEVDSSNDRINQLQEMVKKQAEEQKALLAMKESIEFDRQNPSLAGQYDALKEQAAKAVNDKYIEVAKKRFSSYEAQEAFLDQMDRVVLEQLVADASAKAATPEPPKVPDPPKPKTTNSIGKPSTKKTESKELSFDEILSAGISAGFDGERFS